MSSGLPEALSLSSQSPITDNAASIPSRSTPPCKDAMVESRAAPISFASISLLSGLGARLESLAPVEGAQEVRVVIGPDRRVGVELAGRPTWVVGHTTEISIVAGHHHPVGDELAWRALFGVVLGAAGNPGVLRHVPEHGLQVQVAIGYVH